MPRVRWCTPALITALHAFCSTATHGSAFARIASSCPVTNEGANLHSLAMQAVLDAAVLSTCCKLHYSDGVHSELDIMGMLFCRGCVLLW
jgi:hypothetical protein